MQMEMTKKNLAVSFTHIRQNYFKWKSLTKGKDGHYIMTRGLVKVIQHLGNRIEAWIEMIQGMFNKDLEELKKKQW